MIRITLEDSEVCGENIAAKHIYEIDEEDMSVETAFEVFHRLFIDMTFVESSWNYMVPEMDYYEAMRNYKDNLFGDSNAE